MKAIDIHAGGGTPSLIDEEWEDIIQTVWKSFDVPRDCKFRIEWIRASRTELGLSFTPISFALCFPA